MCIYIFRERDSKQSVCTFTLRIQTVYTGTKAPLSLVFLVIIFRERLKTRNIRLTLSFHLFGAPLFPNKAWLLRAPPPRENKGELIFKSANLHHISLHVRFQVFLFIILLHSQVIFESGPPILNCPIFLSTPH